MDLLIAVFEYPINSPVLFLNYHWVVDSEYNSRFGTMMRLLLRWLILIAAGAILYFSALAYINETHINDVKLLEKKNELVQNLEQDKECLLKELEEQKQLADSRAKQIDSQRERLEQINKSFSEIKLKFSKATELIQSFEVLLNKNKAHIDQKTDEFRNAQKLDEEFWKKPRSK